MFDVSTWVKPRKERCDDVLDEHAQYVGMCAGIEGERDVIDFFKNNAAALPGTARAFKLAALLPTSSAAIERLFSILRRLYSDQQQGMKEDHIRASAMINYNNRSSSQKRVWVGGGLWLR